MLRTMALFPIMLLINFTTKFQLYDKVNESQQTIQSFNILSLSTMHTDVYKISTILRIIIIYYVPRCLCNTFQAIAPEEQSPFLNRNPAPDGHRCGVCPTYFQKICGFDFSTNATHIFDNHCIMDLWNCIHGSEFIKLNYENCLYIGNFAYIHGFKHEDYDYGEDHITMKASKKNPDFI